MSPSCTTKPKQPLDRQKTKSRSFKNKQKHSIVTAEKKSENDEYIYIELDIKCSCPHSKQNNHSSIQFSRRYLQCQSSMPIAILRSYIQQILPHSSMTQVSLFDQHDQLLNDSHLLRSLTTPSSSSSNRTTTDNMIQHVPIRFTLLNTVTSLSHCTCSNEQTTNSLFQPSSSNVNVIKQESINQTLSTCPLIPPTISTSTSSSSSPSKLMNNELSSSIAVSIVNLLTPPSSTVSSSAGPSSSSSSCHSSYRIENTVEPNQSIIDEITSKFGEICPPLPMSSSSRKKNRNRLSKKMMMSLSSNMPLDLSLKKRPLPSSFDIYSSQAKWLKT